jgi:hypothetical protein
MKKASLILMVIFLSLPCHAIGEGSCRIRLNNGGEFTVSRCWREGDQIKFYFHGGIAGIQRDSVREIETIRPQHVPRTQVIGRREPAPPRTDGHISEEPEEEKAFGYYREKKTQLDAELAKLLDRLREVTDRGDAEAIRETRSAVKKISDAIYTLTDEVAKKNGGKIPAGWWKGR